MAANNKPWFINSRGEVQLSSDTRSRKHRKRANWGNAFASREEALNMRRLVRDLFLPDASFWLTRFFMSSKSKEYEDMDN